MFDGIWRYNEQGMTEIFLVHWTLFILLPVLHKTINGESPQNTTVFDSEPWKQDEPDTKTSSIVLSSRNSKPCCSPSKYSLMPVISYSWRCCPLLKSQSLVLIYLEINTKP